MALSMTGYGREKSLINGYDICVEIKSVNNRYFDCNIRVPKGMNFLEDKVRKFISSKVNRGKLDVFLYIKNTKEDEFDIALNEDMAKKYYNVFKNMSALLDIPFDVTTSSMGRFQDIFEMSQNEFSEEEIIDNTMIVLDKALEDFLDMRKKEGISLKNDTLKRIQELESIIEKIEVLLPNSVIEYEKRLKDKIDDYISGANYDESRVLTEIAIFSDKVATFEETIRLKSHFQAFKELVGLDIPVGKKLDFIVQEMNREVNTTCSKCQSIEISKLSIEAKSQIEAIREQIQNIE